MNRVEWYHWMSYFYMYCFLGWCFESAYVSIRERHLVNRGFLKLPLLPLYGTGALLLLWVSRLVSDQTLLLYLVGAISATWLEYVTGYGLERIFRIKYWDYTGQHFQFQGHICLSSSIVWGFMALLVTKVIHGILVKTMDWIPVNVETGVLVILTLIFLYDALQSVKDAFIRAYRFQRSEEV